MYVRKKKRKKSENLLRYYLKRFGVSAELTLSEEEIESLKETWGDLYDAGIINPLWYQLYKEVTGEFNPDFIGSDLHYYYAEYKKIDFDYIKAFSDMNYLDILFPDMPVATPLVHKVSWQYLDRDFHPISLDQAVEAVYLAREDGVIIKSRSRVNGRKSIVKLDENCTKEEIHKLFIAERDIRAEKALRQHEELAKMNPSSINTIRLLTMRVDGEVVSLSSLVHIGTENSIIANYSQDGYHCGIKSDGSLTEYGYDQAGQRFTQHTNGFIFAEGKIPQYTQIVEKVKTLHERVPMFGVISWDICVNEKAEPVLIEINVGQGQIDLHQFNNGPIYGPYKEKILTSIFGNYHSKFEEKAFTYSLFYRQARIDQGKGVSEKVTIPAELGGKEVFCIGESAFAGQDKITEVFCPASLESVDYCAFYRCMELTSITFEKDSLRKIGRSAFNGCSKLKHVVLPEGLEEIEARAFRDCVGLKELYIPSSVTSIAQDAFWGCMGLTILAKPGSEASRYAEREGFSYRPVSE